jgi:hypothetical protein
MRLSAWLAIFFFLIPNTARKAPVESAWSAEALSPRLGAARWSRMGREHAFTFQFAAMGSETPAAVELDRVSREIHHLRNDTNSRNELTRLVHYRRSIRTAGAAFFELEPFVPLMVRVVIGVAERLKHGPVALDAFWKDMEDPVNAASVAFLKLHRWVLWYPTVDPAWDNYDGVWIPTSSEDRPHLPTGDDITIQGLPTPGMAQTSVMTDGWSFIETIELALPNVVRQVVRDGIGPAMNSLRHLLWTQHRLRNSPMDIREANGFAAMAKQEDRFRTSFDALKPHGLFAAEIEALEEMRLDWPHWPDDIRRHLFLPDSLKHWLDGRTHDAQTMARQFMDEKWNYIMLRGTKSPIELQPAIEELLFRRLLRADTIKPFIRVGFQWRMIQDMVRNNISSFISHSQQMKGSPMTRSPIFTFA